MYSEEALQMVQEWRGGGGGKQVHQTTKEQYPFLNPFGHSYCL